MRVAGCEALGGQGLMVAGRDGSHCCRVFADLWFVYARR